MLQSNPPKSVFLAWMERAAVTTQRIHIMPVQTIEIREKHGFSDYVQMTTSSVNMNTNRGTMILESRDILDRV